MLRLRLALLFAALICGVFACHAPAQVPQSTTLTAIAAPTSTASPGLLERFGVGGKNADRSPYAVQKDYDRVTAERDSLLANHRMLDALGVKLDAAKTEAQAPFDNKKVLSALYTLAEDLQEILSKSSDPYKANAVIEEAKVLKNLIYRPYNLTANIYDSTQKSFDTEGNDVAAIFGQAKSASLSHLDWLDNLPTEPYGTGDTNRINRDKPRFQMAQAKVRLNLIDKTKLPLSSDLVATFVANQRNATGWLDKVTTAAKDQSSHIEDLIVGKNKQLEELMSQLATSSERTDERVIYAVVWMIIAIPFAFGLFRIFPPEIAKELIRERTFVEVVSMAFLLVSIIILSTGERLNSESLGTLLGAIAGYLLGRKTGESSATTAATIAATTAAANVAAATPPVTTAPTAAPATSSTPNTTPINPPTTPTGNSPS